MVKSQIAHGSAPELTFRAGLNLGLMPLAGKEPMKLQKTQMQLHGNTDLVYPAQLCTFGQGTGIELEGILYIAARWSILHQVSLTFHSR